ncbi:hypothetical protein MGK_00266 [Candida albicans P57055]|nr:hypothetical protein MGK_00266 [Candida albicans P57055]
MFRSIHLRNKIRNKIRSRNSSNNRNNKSHRKNQSSPEFRKFLERRKMIVIISLVY